MIVPLISIPLCLTTEFLLERVLLGILETLGSDLVAVSGREREKTTFLLEIPKDSLNVNEKGRAEVPPPSALGSMPSLCMNERWPSLTPSACQSLCWRPGLVSGTQ